MTIKHFDIPRGGAYTAPSAEEIVLNTRSGFLLTGSELPEFTEDTVFSEDF